MENKKKSSSPTLLLMEKYNFMRINFMFKKIMKEKFTLIHHVVLAAENVSQFAITTQELIKTI